MRGTECSTGLEEYIDVEGLKEIHSTLDTNGDYHIQRCRDMEMSQRTGVEQGKIMDMIYMFISYVCTFQRI